MRPIYTVIDDAGGAPMACLSAETRNVEEIREAMAAASGCPVAVVYMDASIEERVEEMLETREVVYWREIVTLCTRWVQSVVEPLLANGTSVLQLGSLADLLIGYALEEAEVWRASKAYRPVTPDFTVIALDKANYDEEGFESAKALYWAYKDAFLGQSGRFVTTRSAWAAEFRVMLGRRTIRPRKWKMRRMTRQEARHAT